MSQLIFAEVEYANKKRKTRRKLFLEKMEVLVPWARLEKTDSAIVREVRQPGRQAALPVLGHAQGPLPAVVLQPEW